MGKRPANAGTPRTRAKRKTAQSTPTTTMAPASGENPETVSQDEQGRRRSPCLSSNPPAASTPSVPNPQTMTKNQDPGCHPDGSSDCDDGKQMGEQSPHYETYGSEEDDIDQVFFRFPYNKYSRWLLPDSTDIESECTIPLLDNWVDNYVDGDNVEGRLSANEKQAIMDSLEGWCLYKDWDSLASVLPERSLNCMADLLAQALIAKDITENIMKNPFFYMDLEDDVSGGADVLPPPLGQDLYHLWQKLLKVNRVAAHEWRELTVHLMNQPLPEQGPKDTSAGIRSYRLRRRITRQLTMKMLDRSSPLYPLLSKNVDTERKLARFQVLLKRYRHAAEYAFRMCVDRLGYQFYTDINQAGLYDDTSELYHMEWQTWLTFKHLGNNSQNGRRAVLLLAPLVWQLQFGTEPTPREELDGCEPDPVDEDGWPNAVVCRGLVVLSKHVESEQPA